MCGIARAGGRPIVLFASTFSHRLSAAPKLLEDIAAEIRRREVDQRIDAAGLRLGELLDRLETGRRHVVAPGVVGDVFAHADEDMFVAESGAEFGCVDGSEGGFDGWHGSPPGEEHCGTNRCRASSGQRPSWPSTQLSRR